MRDPRIDPKPGDRVVSEKGIIRTVTKRVGERVLFTRRSGMIQMRWLHTWQDWCRKNNVTATTADGGVSDG